MEPILLRPAEACKVLGIGLTRLREMVADGTLPSMRIGRSLRLPMDGLREFVQTRIEEFQGGRRHDKQRSKA